MASAAGGTRNLFLSVIVVAIVAWVSLLIGSERPAAAGSHEEACIDQQPSVVGMDIIEAQQLLESWGAETLSNCLDESVSVVVRVTNAIPGGLDGIAVVVVEESRAVLSGEAPEPTPDVVAPPDTAPPPLSPEFPDGVPNVGIQPRLAPAVGLVPRSATVDVIAGVRVPDLVDAGRADAESEITRHGLVSAAEPEGAPDDASVSSQNPEPDQLLPFGETVTLSLTTGGGTDPGPDGSSQGESSEDLLPDGTVPVVGDQGSPRATWLVALLLALLVLVALLAASLARTRARDRRRLTGEVHARARPASEAVVSVADQVDDSRTHTVGVDRHLRSPTVTIEEGP